MTRPSSVLIREVGPRDGFQNEPEIIPTDEKIRLINSLGRAGFRRIEVASFVRPDVIPQLSDGVEVLRGIDVPDDVSLMVLIPNSRGPRGESTNAMSSAYSPLVRVMWDASGSVSRRERRSSCQPPKR